MEGTSRNKLSAVFRNLCGSWAGAPSAHGTRLLRPLPEPAGLRRRLSSDPGKDPGAVRSNPGASRAPTPTCPPAEPRFHAGPQDAAADRVPPQVTGQDAVCPRPFAWIPQAQGPGAVKAFGRWPFVHYLWPEARHGCPGHIHVPWIPRPAAPPTLPTTALAASRALRAAARPLSMGTRTGVTSAEC